MAGALCGVWIDPAGVAHLSRAQADGSRREETAELRPFAWLTGEAAVAAPTGVTLEPLAGPGVFTRLAHAATPAALGELARTLGRGNLDTLRPLEHQFLLQSRARLYADLAFTALRRCQLDIETDSPDGGFSDADRAGDRVLAIGLRLDGVDRLLELAAPTDAAEKALLEEFNAVLRAADPDTIEGHNLFKFDLDYLRRRCRRHQVPCAWGRFGQRASFRASRLKVAERWVDFPRCDLPGRAVIDTFLLVQIQDVSTRELTSYGLKEVARHFGLTPEDGDGRTYLAGDRIGEAWRSDRDAFRAYLRDDLRETAGLADRLLPTYFEQAKAFPLLLQEATLRGTAGKIDLLLLEPYYHARQACPAPQEVAPFEGGYTRSFQAGVFRHVLHFDVASLYPSLLLHLGKNPRSDSLGVFIPLLTQLRDYRLDYKQRARTAPTAEERAEAQARQTNFKILINSFYGYLGFSGARFGDGELAAEVTRRGRELLQALIDTLAAAGATILEADTDGIYLSSPEHYDQPEALLARAAAVLPAGIELEFDGRYEAMWCYKAKNYALREGDSIILRGSALRSRGIEPYLQELTDALIGHLLGVNEASPLARWEELQKEIAAGRLPVARLAKTEALAMNPDAYARWVEGGGKPRRAAAEAARWLEPAPRMGDRVSYYLLPRQKGQTSDWQRARPVELFDAREAPYDPKHYLKKLDDWLERYGEFIDAPPGGGEVQGELL
jgi:DNA polymerase, archaea type